MYCNGMKRSRGKSAWLLLDTYDDAAFDTAICYSIRQYYRQASLTQMLVRYPNKRVSRYAVTSLCITMYLLKLVLCRIEGVLYNTRYLDGIGLALYNSLSQQYRHQ